MEQKQSRARYDEFSEQFTAVLHDHWADILQIINRQSPRAASLLRLASPAGFKRVNGIWHIQIQIKRTLQHDKLQQPRDNEIVAQAIRLYYHGAAQFKLPRVVIEFIP